MEGNQQRCSTNSWKLYTWDFSKVLVYKLYKVDTVGCTAALLSERKAKPPVWVTQNMSDITIITIFVYPFINIKGSYLLVYFHYQIFQVISQLLLSSVLLLFILFLNCLIFNCLLQVDICTSPKLDNSSLYINFHVPADPTFQGLLIGYE